MLKKYYFFGQLLMILIFIILFTLIVFLGIDYLYGLIYYLYLFLAIVTITITGIINMRCEKTINILVMPISLFILTLIFEIIIVSIFSQVEKLLLFLPFIGMMVLFYLYQKQKINFPIAKYSIFSLSIIGSLLILFFFYSFFVDFPIFLLVFYTLYFVIQGLSLLIKNNIKKLFSYLYIFDWLLLFFYIYLINVMSLIINF